MATCEAHRRRERNWHANCHDGAQEPLCQVQSQSLPAVPTRVRSTPQSRQARGTGTAGTTVAGEQLDLPLIGLRKENGQVIANTADSERAGFLPYGPLVNEWLAFLAERLTAEFLRDVEPKL